MATHSVIPCPPKQDLPDHIREQKQLFETQLRPRLDEVMAGRQQVFFVSEGMLKLRLAKGFSRIGASRDVHFLTTGDRCGSFPGRLRMSRSSRQIRSSRWPKRMTWQRRHDQLIHCERRRRKITVTANFDRSLDEAKESGFDTHAAEWSPPSGKKRQC